MITQEIRQKFLEFMKSKGHTIVPSSSLLPDDPSVLLTTAGMQQFKHYYTGEADAMRDFAARSTASVQKCFRTSDIDEVGDETHLTFFEMLGNFSFGGYFKKEAITYAHEFITRILNLTISYVTVFEGLPSAGVPKDEESKDIWRTLGVNDIREELWDVFWGPTGNKGPCGPTTEIYCKNALGQDVEIWNIVFNEFMCDNTREELIAGNAHLTKLATPGIDTGMGLERLAMITQEVGTIFDTDALAVLVDVVSEDFTAHEKRIVADHIRASVFLLADGVRPANKGAGYILRRLIRRVSAIEHHKAMAGVIHMAAVAAIHQYQDAYPELQNPDILTELQKEQDKFAKTLTQGLRELARVKTLDARSAFTLFESFGLPFEIIRDFGGEKAADLTLVDFEKEFARHQEASRAGLEKKFGGHGLLLDTGELKAANEEELAKVTKLHTATHLLQQALREVLGNSVSQRGSDITAERLRFDFTFERKVTPEELAVVEQKVQEAIAHDLPVQYVELPLAEAKKTGALYFFQEKYPDTVKVYFTGSDISTAYSKEFCGGPHVTHTGELGVFTIMKEESSSAGVRRIRATVT
ncbi:MAG: alanine--tRNA ligase-related protein [Patescibacteria group bacterium]